MAWGFYCAICGGPFHNAGLLPDSKDYQYPEDSDVFDASQLREREADEWFDEEECCDNTVLNEQSVAWLNDARAIGKNKHKAFITGTGFETPDQSGEVTVNPGDDEHVPQAHELLYQEQPGKLQLDVYYTVFRPLRHNSYPVHVKCFEILQQVHDQRSSGSGQNPTSLDLDLLHKGMESCEVSYKRHLNLDGYAEFRGYLGQWWEGPNEGLEVRALRGDILL